MKKTKFIKRQDSGFKLSYGNSGETSLNLSNEIFELISQGSLSRGEEQNITFRIFKEDYVKAMSFIIMKLPLYKSSSNSSNKVDDCLATFRELYSNINAFFGSNRTADYTVTLFYRTDGRFYLKGLRVKGFSIRDYLVENYSAIQFDDEESGVLKLRILSDIEDVDNVENDHQNHDKNELDNTLEQYSSYRPYITAIKSKPFLLLAGISGTGKSRIVRELARACWDEGSEEFNAQKPRNFEMVQVKPNWHDSSELIGYVSRVSGEPIYVVGDFLKFVARAWEEPDVPYFLCLDEMNLAPVEQYFAEYLSVIESRKADAEGNIATDPILQKSKEDWYRVLTSELTNDDTIRNRFLNSRKVLDRAMTIEMNEVDLKGGLTSRYEEIGKLGAAELIGTAVEGVDVYSAYQAVCDKVINYLEVINNELEGTPFKIAYRTRNEALLYIVNNLPYRKDDESEDDVILRALDEITNMKILSRIEGDADKIGNLLERLTKAIKEQLGDGYTSDNSVSLKKLEEMIRKLSSGYTSFWS